MTQVLLATASDDIFRAVDSAIVDELTTVVRVRAGFDVVETINSLEPDLVILDLQIGNMGGIATCIAIRQEEGYDRMRVRPVGLLLDRAADDFLANQAGADAFVVKPLNALKLKGLVNRLLESSESAESAA